MMPYSEKSVADLKKQIADKLPDNKRELVRLAEGTDTYSPAPVCKYRKDGQIESQTDEVYDLVDGKLLSVKEITWSYYPGGEVDLITITEFDGNRKQIFQETIKHYLDETQPTRSKR